MKFIFEPYEGADILRFSMSREEIRHDLDLKYNEFKKTKFSKNTTDDYGFFHAYYDEKNLLEAIEFFSSGHEILLEKMNILSQEYAQLREFLLDGDEDLKVDGESIISHKYGLSVYAPGSSENAKAKVESVLVFRKGYF